VITVKMIPRPSPGTAVRWHSYRIWGVDVMGRVGLGSTANGIAFRPRNARLDLGVAGAEAMKAFSIRAFPSPTNDSINIRGLLKELEKRSWRARRYSTR